MEKLRNALEYPLSPTLSQTPMDFIDEDYEDTRDNPTPMQIQSVFPQTSAPETFQEMDQYFTSSNAATVDSTEYNDIFEPVKPIQLLASTCYPLSVVNNNKLYEHIHYIHVGLGVNAGHFETMVKIDCVNKYCYSAEVLLEKSAWIEILDIRIEHKFRRFFNANDVGNFCDGNYEEDSHNNSKSDATPAIIRQAYDKRMTLQTRLPQLSLEFKYEDSDAGKSLGVSIKIDNTHAVYISKEEFERMLYLAPLVNYCIRSLQHNEFEQFYYNNIRVLGDLLKREFRYNTNTIANDFVFFNVDKLCSHSAFNSGQQDNSRFYQLLFEVCKFYPDKLLEDVYYEIQN